MNNLPKKGINNIVNERILGYDHASCERILNRILDEKREAEYKKAMQQ